MEYSEEQLQRYARHIVLPEVGGVGQTKLIKSKVLVVGAGGLGAPILLYLAAAGVGTIGVVDDDIVELSNLQRQVIHSSSRLGQPKVESASYILKDINPEIRIITHNCRLNRENGKRLISDYDIIADGSDNFATRFLLADIAHLIGKTLVSAAILRFEGQISTFKSHLGEPYPCYRCLFPEAPADGLVPSCSEGGVLGAVAGIMGSLQAIEIIKEIIGIGESLAGQILLFNALETRFSKIKLVKDPECELCGNKSDNNDLFGNAHR